MKINLSLNFIRYINLLERLTKVRAKNCFIYNNSLFYVVSKKDLGKAIGRNGKNMKLICSTLKKRVRIILEPRDNKDKISFIKSLIEPVKVDDIKIKSRELEIKAGIEERSILIGRNRSNEKELLEILDSFFNIKKITFSK